MPRACGAGGHAGGHAVGLRHGLVVNPVDTQRAFLHDAGIGVVFARAIGAGPGTELAADAGVLVDQHDAVFLALVGCAGRAHGYAGGVLAMQAGTREMDGPAFGAFAGLECVDAVEPDAVRIGAVGIVIRQRRRMSPGVPFLAVHCAGVTADAGVQIDDEAQFDLLPLGFACRQQGHDLSPCPGRFGLKRAP